MVRPDDDVRHTQRNGSRSQWSDLSVCSVRSGVTRKLPVLPGPHPLSVGGPGAHRSGKDRHRVPRLLPHLQRHPPP
ncbi:hypothetical protein NL108_009128, partial [Boleophthalmus pectinirostris]